MITEMEHTTIANMIISRIVTYVISLYSKPLCSVLASDKPSNLSTFHTVLHCITGKHSAICGLNTDYLKYQFENTNQATSLVTADTSTLMTFNMWQQTEIPSTNTATVWFLSCVNSNVSLQSSLFTKTFSTEWTTKWSLPCMTSQVYN